MTSNEKRSLAILAGVAAVCLSGINLFGLSENRAKAAETASRLRSLSLISADAESQMASITARIAAIEGATAQGTANEGLSRGKELEIGRKVKEIATRYGASIVRYSEKTEREGRSFEFTLQGSPLSMMGLVEALDRAMPDAAIPSFSLKVLPDSGDIQSIFRIAYGP